MFYGHAARAFLEQKGYEDVDSFKIYPYIVAVEVNRPYECVVYELPDEWFSDAEWSLIESMHRLKTCKDNNNWVPYNVKDGLITLNVEEE